VVQNPGSDASRGVPFPRSTRLPHAAYADQSTLFHLVLRTHPEVGRLPNSVLGAIWEAVLNERHRGSVHLTAACLMPDHLHLVLRPGERNVLRFLNGFKSWTTRVAWGAGHRGTLWQPGMWDRTVSEGSEAGELLRYVVDNPVAAGLVSEWSEWPFVWMDDIEA